MNIVAPLLLLASPTQNVEVIDGNRFKISAVIANPDSPTDHFNAAMGIMKRAQKVCEGLKRGNAVSEGTVHIDTLPPAKGKKKEQAQVSEFYSCAT